MAVKGKAGGKGYTWYQRRTSLINRALGTSWSPTQIFKQQQFADKWGYGDTPETQLLKSLGTDARYVRAGSEREQKIGLQVISQTWKGFIEGSTDRAYYIGGWGATHQGGAQGELLYQQQYAFGKPTGKWERYDLKTGRLSVIENLPATARPRTAYDIEKQLEEEAAKVRVYREASKRGGGPDVAFNYESIPYELV